jgi:hypothetical protein
MVASFMPLAHVTAPPIQPARFGLFSVANVIDTNDPHIIGGVTYETMRLCTDGTVFVAGQECTDGVFVDNIATTPFWAEAVPVIVSFNYECTGPFDLAAFQAESVAAIAANQERMLSKYLFPFVLDPADAHPTTNIGTSVTDALATLEGRARSLYSGQAVIHAAASTVSQLTVGYQIERVGNHLETQSGNLVHPIAITDHSAMYMTGAISIWRGPNKVLDPMQQVTDPGGARTNTWRTPSSTPMAVGVDCGFFDKITL